MTRPILVIGYGNILRTDDGIGWRVAECLADDPRLAGVTVIGCHQLTPELALDLSQASLAILVDACVGPAAGTFDVERVERAERAGQRHGRSTSMSHQLDPGGLVELARELYGRVPEVLVMSIGTASMDAGDRLSSSVEEALPDVVEAVVELIAEHTRLAHRELVAGRGHA